MESVNINLLTWPDQPVFRSTKYKLIWERFSYWCAEQGLPKNIGNEIQWLEELKDQGMSAATISLYGYAVKACLIDNYAMKIEDQTTANFTRYQIEAQFRSFKMPKAVKRKSMERVITDEELRLILSLARIKARIMIEFLAATGCRVSEMISIRLRHVKKIRESEYRIRIMGKGSKERTVKINGGLRKRIRKAYPETTVFLFESSNGQQYTRQNVFNVIHRAGVRAGIESLHPHSLRHYFATRMIDKTGDIEAVSQYLGHSDVSTTLAMYYHGKPLTMEQLSLDLYGDRGKSRREINA